MKGTLREMRIIVSENELNNWELEKNRSTDMCLISGLIGVLNQKRAALSLRDFAASCIPIWERKSAQRGCINPVKTKSDELFHHVKSSY